MILHSCITDGMGPYGALCHRDEVYILVPKSYQTVYGTQATQAWFFFFWSPYGVGLKQSFQGRQTTIADSVMMSCIAGG